MSISFIYYNSNKIFKYDNSDSEKLISQILVQNNMLWVVGSNPTTYNVLYMSQNLFFTSKNRRQRGK